MIDFAYNPIIPADYKSRGRGLPYEASPFREAFYDFIAHQTDPRFQAALVLLGHLVQREEPNLRRYVAILGNPALRKQVFDL